MVRKELRIKLPLGAGRLEGRSIRIISYHIKYTYIISFFFASADTDGRVDAPSAQRDWLMLRCGIAQTVPCTAAIF
jgi:hypothetical protein